MQQHGAQSPVPRNPLAGASSPRPPAPGLQPVAHSPRCTAGSGRLGAAPTCGLGRDPGCGAGNPGIPAGEGRGGGPGEIIGANKDQKNNPLVPYFLENACHPEEEENGQASPRLWVSCVPAC